MSQEFSIVGNLLLKVDGAEAGLNKLKNSLSKLEMPKGLENSFKKSFSNLDGLFEKYKAQLKDGFNTKGDVSSFAKTGKQIEAEYDKISAAVTKLTGKEVSLKVDLSAIQKAEKELEKLIVQRDKLTKDIKGGLGLTKMFEAMQASDVGRRGTKVFDASNVLQTSLGRGDLEKARTDVETLISELNRMSEARKQALEARTETSFSNIIDALRNSIINADNSLDELNGDIKTTSDSMASMRADQMEKVGKAIEDAVGDADRLTSGFKQINGGAQEAAESMYSMTHQLEQLKTSTQYFFSLSNMINLFKRGVREAVQTVKDLDAAMTQTAVVTDFSVGDMWAKLPEYTAQANSLGATIQDMYESTTLYYQQGLNTQQAMGIATETMKMARIAGLEAADATDMMTAALRGFNMEINEASAQHINDVYSQLAAKTASDTEELGTAMQRTASIAHSAGMSFEGTTAFLAQAIETTREPAENLGTAMKTIIARFQELKKNPLEMTEVDGEVVDYNKVDAALKTIGVDLKDTNGQFRALDEVFLDISQRWDGLSQTQQRYIATTAAGSRQQSRFIAMMSDYNRTMELMGYANDSAGASQAQFNKTLDSLEAKLNKFKTAWQQFLMGIMNDSWTKGIVDGATTVLSNVNKLINTLSFGSKGIKSFLSIFTAFTGLKAAGRLANIAIGGLGGILDPKSSVFKGMFSGASGMKQGANAAQAKAISDPIVTVLKQIYAKMNDHKVTEEGLTRGSWKDFKNAQSKFQTSAKTGTIGDTIGALDGLDKAQINGVLANNPAIESRLQRGFNKYIADMDLTDGTKKATSKAIPGIFKAFKQDPNMSPDAFVKALRPDQIGVSLVKAGQGEAGKELIRQFAKQRDDAFMKSVGYDPKDASSVANYKSLFNSKDKGKGLREAYVDFIKNYKGAEGEALPEPSKWDNVASKVGAVGAMFGTAGQAVTSFGMALSNLGLEKVGNGIASLGTHLSSIGASISSVAMTISAVSNAGGLKAIFAPVVPYLPYIIAAAAALATIGVIAHQAAKETKAIKDSAEEVTKTFEETSEKTKENISNLKQYKDEMARLSQGVDQNGNNVSLSNDDYDEYLKIVDEVAAMNPEIVRGYNAQGHAIIDNNTALQKTLDLQEQINKETTDQYLQQTSLEKLLAARNLRGSDYTKNTTFVGKGVSRADLGRAQFMYGDSNYGIHKSDIEKQIIPLQKQAVKVAKELQSSDLYKQDEKQVKSLLSTYGIDFDQLLEGEKKSVDNFVKNQDAIESQLSNAAENLDVDFSDKFNKAFENLNIDTDAFNAAIEPIFKNLATRVSNDSTFKDIAPELQSSVMAGLKEIAKQDISASEMIQRSNELVGTFRNLADQSGKYGEAIKLVEAEQQKFGDSLDEEAYAKGVQPAIDKLYELRDAAAEMHSVTGDAVAEFYDNQIAQIENFASSGMASLNEALNTMSGQFAEAKGAYEEFSNAVKDNDFYTAADNMKKIFDEIDNDIDKAGLGSKKFWMGAEELLGSENIDGLSKEAVAKQLNNIKPLLQEGEDGFQAFWDLIDQHKDKLNELDGVTVGEDGWLKEWPDDLSEVSKELGISEKLLASLLDKSRQFAHIDLSDPAKVREAIATSGTAISGLQGDKKNLYVKEDSLRASLREADYTTKAEQDHEIERMQNEEQIITIGNPEDLSDKQVSAMKKDLGLGDLPGLIETFGQTGEYNKEEMQALAERFDLFDDQKGFDEAYNDWVEKSLDPAQSKQTDLLGQLNSNVASIAASVVSKRIQEGHLDKPTAEQSEYATYGQKGVADTLGQLFSKGKDGNGNYFQSDASFERNKQAIEEQKKSYEDYLAVLKEGRENAKGTEQEKFDKEIASYEKMIGYLDQWLEEGEAAYNKYKQEEGSNQEQNQPDTNKKDLEKDTDDKKPETVYDEEQLKKQQEFWSNIDSKVFGFFDKLFTTDFGEQGRTQKSTTGEGIDITGTPTEDPKEVARQAAREKFQSWIQGLIEGSQNASEDPKTIATQKARDDYKSYIDGIREGAINQKMTGGIDAEVQAKTQEKIASMWQAVKAAFTSGGTEDPKVEAGKKAADIWKSIWSSVKKAFTTNPKVDIDPKTNGKDKTNDKETTETTEDLNVSYTSKIANPDEIKASLEQQITSLLNTIASQQSKLSATATVNVKQGTIEKPKAQKAVVNYTKGKQAKADKQTTTVDYKLGTQAPPKPKSTTVNYTLGSQASPSPKTVDISPHFVGTWEKTIKLKPSGANGINNKITTSPLPNFGSLAKGSKYGKVGPKGRGGLTLTGEEGFEIAWLPSESHSMIVGANGPQMVNLPSDAVVYTHEQSKKILKQKSIPAGSHRGKSTSPVVDRRGVSDSTGGGGGAGKKDKNKGGTDKQNKKNADNAAKVIKKAGNVNAWWWNMGKKVESLQRKIDKTLKEIQKTTKTIGKTLADVALEGDGYIKNLNRQITLNQRMQSKAQDKLNILDKGPGKTSKAQKSINKAQKKVDDAEKKLAKAKKSKNQKEIKQAKKELKRAKKNLSKKQNTANYSTVSYDVTTVKKDKKGKKTKSKKTKKQKINLAPFIKLDKATGAYVVDYNKINSKDWDKSKKNAVMEAAKKKAEDYQKKRDTAEDNIQKAKDALDEFSKQLYEEFYGWELQLTKIWNISQKIEETTGHIGRLSSYLDLLDAKVASGTIKEINTEFVSEYLQAFQDKMRAGVQKMYQQIDSIELRKFELQDKLNINANDEAIANIGGRVSATEALQESINKAQIKADKKNDAYASKKSVKDSAKTARDTAKKEMETTKKKYGKNSKQYKKAKEDYDKAQAKYEKALKEFNTAKAARKTANESLKGLQSDYDKGIEAGTYYSETEQLANKGYVQELQDDKLIRELAREFTKFQTNDDGTVSVDFDTEAFIKARDAGRINGTTAERLQTYVQSIVDQTNELNSMFEDTTQSLIEQEQILEQLKDDWAGYGEQLLSYVEEQQSKELDKIKKLTEAIDNSLKDLLDRVKQDLDRRRQQEDNAKTEKNITKKQQRLVVLQANTSGGNQVEIARLQEEITQEQQDYQRTLEDQLLDRLNRQADEASKQREKQISLQEGILQATNNVALVNKWMDNPEKYKAEIQKAFYDQAEYNSLTKAQQEKVERDFNKMYAGLLTNETSRLATEQSIADTQGILAAIKASIAGLANKINSGEGSNIEEPEAADNGNNNNGGDEPVTEEDEGVAAKLTQAEAEAQYKDALLKAEKNKKTSYKEIQNLKEVGKAAGIPLGKVLKDLAGTPGITWKQILTAVKGHYSKYRLAYSFDSDTFKTAYDAVYGPGEYKKNRKYAADHKKDYPKYKFAAGGLANYTGPAWLDGTPSKPELVLNSTDTKNLIALKDVLSKVMKGSLTTTTENQGDILYEININVDRIEKDYDVDQVVDKVKKEIVKSAGYRNVTQVRNFR